MSYVEGFVVAVPTSNKEIYRAHAESAVPHFKRLGATRLVESWGDGVPHGDQTDFYRAVEAKEDETPVFSFVEYPSKEVRDQTNKAMMDDPGFQSMGEMPFDARRMIWSGFSPFLDERAGSGSSCGYIDGYLMVVPAGNEQAYRDMAAVAAPILVQNGALRVVEAMGDDLMEGKTTDYRKATQLKEGESLVFSWIEWPDKATRETGMAAFMEDDRIKNGPSPLPFDTARVVSGAFETIVDQ